MTNNTLIIFLAPSLLNTILIHLDAHAQIAVHPPLSSESMHSELGVVHAIFIFCDMLVVKNVE